MKLRDGINLSPSLSAVKQPCRRHLFLWRACRLWCRAGRRRYWRTWRRVGINGGWRRRWGRFQRGGDVVPGGGEGGDAPLRLRGRHGCVPIGGVEKGGWEQTWTTGVVKGVRRRLSSPREREGGEGETGGVGVERKASVSSVAGVVISRADGGSPIECGTDRGMEGVGDRARQCSQNEVESQTLTYTHTEKENSGRLLTLSHALRRDCCGVCTGSVVLSFSSCPLSSLREPICCGNTQCLHHCNGSYR